MQNCRPGLVDLAPCMSASLHFFSLILLYCKQKVVGCTKNKKKVCLLIFKNQMSCINQFNLKFVCCGTVDGQHMRQEEKKIVLLDPYLKQDLYTF